MALVDFTNAVLHFPSVFPGGTEDMNFSTSYLCDANGNTIVTNYRSTRLINEEKRDVRAFSGNFTTSGTEFYFGAYANVSSKWKITGISFQAGDSYSFQIPIYLTCN